MIFCFETILLKIKFQHFIGYIGINLAVFLFGLVVLFKIKMNVRGNENSF